MRKILKFYLRQKEGYSQGKPLWTRLVKGGILGAFVAGIFMANFMGREAVSNAGILNDYFIEKFQYTDINGENLFFYIIGERVPLLLLLCLLAFTSLGIVGGILVLAWQGFTVGFMLSTAIAKFGIKGILLVLGGLFPQYLFYLPVYFLYCCLTVYLRKRMLQEKIEMVPERGYLYGAGVVAGIGLLLLFVTGIFLESYVNPVLLKKILNFF
ncbi:MAG: hypothetical protein HFI74_10265 [Lachnospiraceae bacterium]|jgi:hypothetical protein|nr:hypothetical protein [Lachnospiraceae bacterium]